MNDKSSRPTSDTSRQEEKDSGVHNPSEAPYRFRAWPFDSEIVVPRGEATGAASAPEAPGPAPVAPAATSASDAPVAEHRSEATAAAPLKAVLVTGVTSPLGEALARYLLRSGMAERVLGVGLQSLGALSLRNDPRFTYLSVNLARERDIRALLFGAARDAGAEALVHTALHRRATSGGERVHKQNVESTRLFLELCERHPTIRHFVLRSHAEVYRVQAEAPDVLRETHPLELRPGAPQWIRDRVEADLEACARMGLSALRVNVLRCAEILAPEVGSQLWDYLRSRVAFVPVGYDPMLNLLTLEDAARALALALRVRGMGVYNIPGYDTLPLSAVIRRMGRVPIPVPGGLLEPLYRWRRAVLGTDFRYDLNAWRFHYSGVLDGRRAQEKLGFVPEQGIAWARAASAR